MQRKPIDYKDRFSIFLPKGMLDYFDFTDYSDMGKYYIFRLEKKYSIPEEHPDLSLIAKGFYLEITVTDFPIRGRTVYFKVKLRRWEDKTTDKTYNRNRNRKLVADRIRITAEFGSFLKELS